MQNIPRSAFFFFLNGNYSYRLPLGASHKAHRAGLVCFGLRLKKRSDKAVSFIVNIPTVRTFFKHTHTQLRNLHRRFTALP